MSHSQESAISHSVSPPLRRISMPSPCAHSLERIAATSTEAAMSRSPKSQTLRFQQSHAIDRACHRSCHRPIVPCMPPPRTGRATPQTTHHRAHSLAPLARVLASHKEVEAPTRLGPIVACDQLTAVKRSSGGISSSHASWHAQHSKALLELPSPRVRSQPRTLSCSHRVHDPR